MSQLRQFGWSVEDDGRVQDAAQIAGNHGGYGFGFRNKYSNNILHLKHHRTDDILYMSQNLFGSFSVTSHHIFSVFTDIYCSMCNYS